MPLVYGVQEMFVEVGLSKIFSVNVNNRAVVSKHS